MAIATADLVTQAARLADEFVRPLGRRWLHVQAVARTAEDFRSSVRPEEAPVLVAAAWLHDIGYSSTLADTGFHPIDGARYLRTEGFPDRVVNLVAHHSGARFEAEERGLSAALDEFELEDSPVMDALLAADLTTGPAGEKLDYRERIAEILGRYPESHPVHRAWLRAADELEDSVQRAYGRIFGYPINGSDLSSR